MFGFRPHSVMCKTFARTRYRLGAKVERWSEWSKFHVTYATPPRCKTPFPNYTIIYIVKQWVIYVVFVLVYLLHSLHLSPLIGTKSAQRRLAPPPSSPHSHFWSATGATGAECRVLMAVRGLQERRLYSRINFKLNRAAHRCRDRRT